MVFGLSGTGVRLAAEKVFAFSGMRNQVEDSSLERHLHLIFGEAIFRAHRGDLEPGPAWTPLSSGRWLLGQVARLGRDYPVGWCVLIGQHGNAGVIAVLHNAAGQCPYRADSAGGVEEQWTLNKITLAELRNCLNGGRRPDFRQAFINHVCVEAWSGQATGPIS